MGHGYDTTLGYWDTGRGVALTGADIVSRDLCSFIRENRCIKGVAYTRPQQAPWNGRAFISTIHRIRTGSAIRLAMVFCIKYNHSLRKGAYLTRSFFQSIPFGSLLLCVYFV